MAYCLATAADTTQRVQLPTDRLELVFFPTEYYPKLAYVLPNLSLQWHTFHLYNTPDRMI